MGGTPETSRLERAPILGFLVIGAAKSGTTTLHHLLRDHPELRLPDDKEAPFFAKTTDVVSAWPSFAEDHFGGLAPGVVAGKITPRYLGDIPAAERVAAVAPDVRLAVVLRHPVERTFSKYRLLLRQGKTTQTFDDHVAAQLDPEALDRARSSVVSIGDANVVRSEYARQLRHWLQYFDHEQLKVFFTEELESDPQLLVDQLTAHIGVTSGWVPDELGKRFYVGGDRQRFPGLVPTLKRVPGVRSLWAAIPKQQRRRTHIWFNRQFNVKQVEDQAELTDETRQLLLDFYADDVADLQRLTGRTVPWPDFQLIGDVDSSPRKATP